jgi:hypothetical protein
VPQRSPHNPGDLGKEIDMYDKTRITRIAGDAERCGVACLAPAAGADGAHGGDTVDVGYAKHSGVDDRPDDLGRLLNDIDTPLSPATDTSTPTSGPIEVPVDDGSLELFQVALGALAGASLVGAGAAVRNGRLRMHAPRTS